MIDGNVVRARMEMLLNQVGPGDPDRGYAIEDCLDIVEDALKEEQTMQEVRLIDTSKYDVTIPLDEYRKLMMESFKYAALLEEHAETIQERDKAVKMMEDAQADLDDLRKKIADDYWYGLYLKYKAIADSVGELNVINQEACNDC